MEVLYAPQIEGGECSMSTRLTQVPVPLTVEAIDGDTVQCSHPKFGSRIHAQKIDVDVGGIVFAPRIVLTNGSGPSVFSAEYLEPSAAEIANCRMTIRHIPLKPILLFVGAYSQGRYFVCSIEGMKGKVTVTETDGLKGVRKGDWLYTDALVLYHNTISEKDVGFRAEKAFRTAEECESFLAE